MEGGRWRVLAPARVILVQSQLLLHDQPDPLPHAQHVSEGGRQSETDGTREGEREGGREGGREGATPVRAEAGW